jgi:UDP-N-acetylglucosamine--N-acetylmuramyl-(pentapeptide) pyrophosphoryl-undecaprenol N-acetylglucosamine transferase
VRSRRDVVIAGGGTGGHIVPSLQIARGLVARGRRPESIELYGSTRGQEATTWPKTEFPYRLLPGRGIRRSLKPSAIGANVGAIAGLAWACARASGSFLVRRPRVVVIVGGYASFPAGAAAVLTRTPLVCMTTDAVPGAVNRLLGRFAAANAVAFEHSELPRAQVTGSPVRPELHPLDRTVAESASGRTGLGLPPDRLTVAAFGGSLGARRINDAVAELAREWASYGDRTLYHVTGRRDFDDYVDASEAGRMSVSGDAGAKVPGSASGSGSGSGSVSNSRSEKNALFDRAAGDAGETEGAVGDDESDAVGGVESADARLFYRVVPFEERMPELYAAADVCVTRAGAMTVAELSITGVPSILVPLPGAPRDHQNRNAQALVEIGSAVLVPDAECDGQRLAKELEALLSDPERLRRMNHVAREHSHPDAANRVAELIDAHAR